MRVLLSFFIVIVAGALLSVVIYQNIESEHVIYEKEIVDIENNDSELLKKEEKVVEDILPKNKEIPIENILHEEIEKVKEIILPTITVVKNEPSVSFSNINTQTRDSLVNILCTTKYSSPVKPISGSGVLIEGSGVILTNAHIGQYFLLKNYQTEDFIKCVIRMGSPAEPKYYAKLLYIPEKWIIENAKNLKIENPKGTGENDFAFLILTKSTNNQKSLPLEFPFIIPDITEKNIKKDNNVLLAGYPAGFLGGILIQKDLYISSTITKIKEVFTFKEFTLDVISMGGNIVAQSGVSGGAVVSDNNKLIALISTSSGGETTDERDLNAITLSHINRSLIENRGVTLQELISGNIQNKATEFNETETLQLTKLLEEVLD